MSLLRKELDATALRQRVIANNIANVNTPQFKKSTVRFEEYLKDFLDKGPNPTEGTEGAQLRSGSAQPQSGSMENLPELRVERDENTTMRADGNNVDIDQEMAALAENTILYQIAAQELNERIALLGYVITGRR